MQIRKILVEGYYINENFNYANDGIEVENLDPMSGDFYVKLLSEHLTTFVAFAKVSYLQTNTLTVCTFSTCLKTSYSIF